MITELLNRLKDGRAKIVNDTQTRYFPLVCNNIEDYVVDTMLNELSTEVVQYGKFTSDVVSVLPSEYTPVSYNRDGSYIATSDPRRIRSFVINDVSKIAVACGSGVYFYDNDFNLLERYLGQTNIRAIDINVETDTIVIAKDHKVMSLKLSTFEENWSFGDNVAGYLGDNRCYYIRDIAQLPNGNYAIAQYNGKGYDVESEEYLTSRNDGVVYELNSEDGSLVKTLLYCGDTEYSPETNHIKNPRAMKILAETINDEVIYKMYIATYMNIVAVFEFDSDGNTQHIVSHTTPSELLVTKDISLNDFEVVGNELIVISALDKKIVGYNMETRSITFASGQYSPEYSGAIISKINGFYNPISIFVNSDGDIFVGDDFNDKIKKVYRTIYKYIPYNIPSNIEILQSFKEYIVDENNNYLFKARIDDVDVLEITYKNKQE